MDQTERDRLNVAFKIVTVLSFSMCYMVYEYTRQSNFPDLVQECEAACESHGRLDYATYGKCQCASKYDSLSDINEKKSDIWGLPRR